MVPPTLPPLPITVESGKSYKFYENRLIRRCCTVCDEDHPEIICVRTDKLRVAKWKTCGLMYLPDIPDNEYISNFYNMYCEIRGTMSSPQT